MVSTYIRKSAIALCKNGLVQQAASRSNSSLSYRQALAYAPATRLNILDNHMKVASEENGGATTTVGVFLEVGSRDEKPEKNGIGNLFEHMVFKGTSSRKQADLEAEVKGLGARLEVNRGREISSITATCFNQDVPKIVEILADVVQNSNFDEAEIEAQKEVMLQKLAKAEETDVDGVMQDLLHSVAFQGTPLALSPSGTTETIKALTRDDLLDYRRDHLIAPKIVLSAAGGVSQEQLADLAAKHFDKCDGAAAFNRLNEFCRFTGSEIRVRDDEMASAHIVIGFNTPSVRDEDHLKLELAKVVAGSWDTTAPSLNSGINMANMFNKCSMVNNYKMFNIGYKDTGLFGYHVNTGRMKIMDVQECMAQELRYLGATVSDLELVRAKNQLRTQIFLALESNAAVARDIATQLIYHGKRSTLVELEENIDALTAQDVCATVDKYMYDACHVQAGLGPIEQMFTYVAYQKMAKMGL